MTPWIVAHQAPLSVGILQEQILEWVVMPSLPPGDLPNPGIEPRSPAWQVDSLLSEPPGICGVGPHNLSQILFQLSVLDIAISISRDKHTVKSLDIRKDSKGVKGRELTEVKASIFM